MFSTSIVTRFNPILGQDRRKNAVNLQNEQAELPEFVKASSVALRYYDLLQPLTWEHFPERDLERNYGQEAFPYSAFTLACLVKINEGLRSMDQLQRYLQEHPALAWLLGFNLELDRSHFGALKSRVVSIRLPTQRHFTRLLRKMPNRVPQAMLDCTVTQLQTELSAHDFGKVISLDTKLIIAWVQENNPKAHHKENRFDKTRQPKGDPDCRLGCKRRRNQRASSKEPPPTPQDNPVPMVGLDIGEYYWGYASGVVATKIPDLGEFVLAELTQPFDKPDVSYFYPLMLETERRLGFRPLYGAFDAAYDAAYVYEYFVKGGGFAAVPLVNRGGFKRTFDPKGVPLCEAKLPMRLNYTFRDRTHLYERTMERYACPKLPEKPCPINHKNATTGKKNGCVSTLAAGQGARIRYTMDRDSDAYKQIYNQRTATERINSQAKALGIERPYLRNQQAITNLNTLIYVLINLRALQRVRKLKEKSA